MSYEDIVLGTAANSKIIEVMLRDSTTGQAKASVAYGSVAYSFIREGTNSTVATGTCVDMTLDTYTDHGWKETSIAGVYQFGVPQAALATGKNAVTIKLVVSGAIDVCKRILIMGQDLRAAAIAANTTQFAAQAITCAAPVTIPTSIASPTNITAGTIATVTNLTNAPTNGDLTATMKSSVTAAVPTAAVCGTDAASKVLVTPAQKIVTDGSGFVSCPATQKVDVETIKTQAVTCAAPTTIPTSIASPTNITAGTIATVTNQLTAAAIATGVWQDATAGDFTATGSIGKSLKTNDVAPGGTNGLFIAGTNAATVITTSLTTGAITLTTPIQANIAGVKTTALPAESVGGRDAAALGLFLDVATPALTCAGVNQTIDNPTAAACGTDAAAKVLSDPTKKLVTDANGYVTYANAAPPAASAIKTAIEASGSHLALIKAVTDKVDTIVEVVP